MNRFTFNILRNRDLKQESKAGSHNYSNDLELVAYYNSPAKNLSFSYVRNTHDATTLTSRADNWLKGPKHQHVFSSIFDLFPEPL